MTTWSSQPDRASGNRVAQSVLALIVQHPSVVSVC